jgi:hypothetical protein
MLRASRPGRRRAAILRERAFEPAEALTRWIDRFTEMLDTKRGLASALHSGDPAFAGLPDYFLERLGPTLSALLDAAAAEGAIRGDIGAEDLLYAVAQLCQPCPGGGPSTAGGSSASWSAACAVEAGRGGRKEITGAAGGMGRRSPGGGDAACGV